MADVFLSYARLDRGLAEPIKARLESLGLSVFFDIDGGIDAGDAFPVRIGNAVTEAKAVLALWTTRALGSDWCRKECFLAQQLEKLVPAVLSPVTPADLREFISSSYEDLSDFEGQAKHFGWSQVLASIARKMDRWAETNAENADAQAAVERASNLRKTALSTRPAAGAPSALGQTGAGAAWEKTQKDDVNDLVNFAETYPGTSEAFEARRLATRVRARHAAWKEIEAIPTTSFELQETQVALIKQYIRDFPDDPEIERVRLRDSDLSEALEQRQERRAQRHREAVERGKERRREADERRKKSRDREREAEIAAWVIRIVIGAAMIAAFYFVMNFNPDMGFDR